MKNYVIKYERHIVQYCVHTMSQEDIDTFGIGLDTADEVRSALGDAHKLKPGDPGYCKRCEDLWWDVNDHAIMPHDEDIDIKNLTVEVKP
jgi:hypothetical protein